MRNYWSCGPLADWLRGTPKLKWGTGDEWKEWKIKAKAAHPFRWWLAEEGLDYLQDVYMYVPDKIRSVRYYINNRFITRSHALTAHRRDIRPGSWCDVGNRFLPCLFNELVDFVEVETAWMHVVWDDEARKKYKTSWLRRRGWRTWRSREAGLAHLDWAASLTHNGDWVSEDDPNYGKPTRQALDAMEIKALYLWWTEVRPNRPEPYDVSGWSEYCNSRRSRGVDLLETDPEEDKDEVRNMLNKSHDLEAEFEAEDTVMMMRLINVRNGLWT